MCDRIRKGEDLLEKQGDSLKHIESAIKRLESRSLSQHQYGIQSSQALVRSASGGRSKRKSRKGHKQSRSCSNLSMVVEAGEYYNIDEIDSGYKHPRPGSPRPRVQTDYLSMGQVQELYNW